MKFSSAMQKISPAVQQVKEFARKNPKITYIGGGKRAMGFQAGGVAAESLAAKLTEPVVLLF
ncbi:8331_t:CDS:2 [Diversispora eburnea]|uniref:8331_t:CDS:1 n=1 Tax=Diversispora eburnea TaxID=1213867 RepID=A0A9N9A380_9GLOM|nr:8331_t:CDS:2 [Diversispora eburnea]